MTSFRPHSKGRPWIISISLRTLKAMGSTPMRVVSRERPLIISVSAPLLKMSAVSGLPEAFITALKPCAIDNTPTSTATTPAIPKSAAAEEPLRCQIVRRLNWINAKI